MSLRAAFSFVSSIARPYRPHLPLRTSLFPHTPRTARFPHRRHPPPSLHRRRLCASLLLPTQLLAPLSTATPFSLAFLLLSTATLGLLSYSHPLGKALSPPCVTTLLTLLLSNLLPLPTSHPLFTQVNTALVPLAVPLLLFGADLRRVFQETTRLVRVFTLGSVATVLATLIAYKLIPLSALLGSGDAWKIAAALCARHIGGAVNYVAVVDATGAHADAVAAALAVDNIVVAIYFIVLLLLARGVPQPGAAPRGVTRALSSSPDAIGEDMSPINSTLSLRHGAIALTLSSAICALGVFVDALLPFRLGPIPIITALTLCLATSFPRFFQRYRAAAAGIGVLFMQIFFAAIGIAGSLRSVVRKAPLLFLFSGVQLGLHLGIFWVVGGACGFERSEILISSNANVGGPTTAAGMAMAKEWDTLVIPALLIGVFGYSIATFVSLGVGHFLLKPL